MLISMAETDSINNPLLPQNPNKFYTQFLYKAILVSIFLLLLPLFPSEAPGFINHTINNRSWELLQFVFVGIAVSYGLFSKRNDEETEKEKEKEQMGSTNTQSYVARLLQVSSVFDDDSESTKVQTWNSQCYRGEPIVVVAKETSLPEEHTKKPLLLPVRNLKTESFSGSNYRPSSSKSSPEEESPENIVLRSPIPWRSRSGRMEVKESSDIKSPSFRYQSTKSSNPSEIQSKSLEDPQLIEKSSFTPPPPPPPPPKVKPYTENKTNWNSRKDSRSRMRSVNEDQYLSDDKEIERFIERRVSMNETYPKGEEEEEEKKKEIMNDSEDEQLEELASKSNGEMVGNEDGPDVDKKADEFIAKFREQIRLQRIASIRRTTTQNTPKTR